MESLDAGSSGTPVPKKSRLARPVVGLLILLGLVVPGGAWYAVERITSRAGYDRAVDRYKAGGGPTDPLSLLPPALPPDFNESGRYLRALGIEDWEFDRDRKEAWHAQKGTEEKVSDPMKRQLTEEEWSYAEASVLESREMLTRFIEGSAKCDLQFPLQYGQKWMMLMPHVSGFARMGKLLYLDVRCRLRKGESEGVWRRIDAILFAAHALRNERPLVSQMVRMLLLEYGLAALEEVLGSVAPPPPEWTRQASLLLDGAQLRRDVNQSFLFELAMVFDTVDSFLSGRPVTMNVAGDLSGLQLWMAKPRMWQGGARCFDRLLRLRDAFGQPAAAAIDRVEAVDREFSKDVMAYSFLIPAFRRILCRQAFLHARCVLAGQALTIRARILHGKEAPVSIPDLAVDPLLGKPLHYERTDRGFILSVDASLEELQNPWALEEVPSWSCPRE